MGNTILGIQMRGEEAGEKKEKGGRGDSTRHRRKTVGLITRGNEAGE